MADNTFAQGFIDDIKERVAGQRDSENKLRDMKAQNLMQSAFGRDEKGDYLLSDMEAEQVLDEVDKLYGYNKNSKDLIGKARILIGKIRQMGGNNKAMANRATQQTTNALGGGQGGALIGTDPNLSPEAYPGQSPAQAQPMSEQTPIGGSSTMLPPPPQRSLGAMAAPVQQAQSSPVGLMRAGMPNETKDKIATEGRANDEWTRRQGILAKNALELVKGKTKPQKVGSYTGDDKKMHAIYADFTKLDENGDPVTFEIDSEGNTQPARSWVTGAQISATTAKERAAAGEVFKSPDGSVIDINSMGPNEELRAWAGGAAGFYDRYNQQTRQLISNNRVKTYPALDPSQQTDQGQARVGNTTMDESLVQDVNSGQTVAIPTFGSSMPMGGSAPSGTVVPPAKPVAKPSATAPTAAPGVPAASATPSATAAPSSSAGRVIPGVLPSGQLNTQRAIAVPIKEVARQLHGDPKDPNFEPLSSFAHLADDPKAVGRIGNALNILLDNMAAADAAGGGVSAHLGGVGVSTGGLWNYIKNETGFTSVLSKSQVDTTQKAIEALTPEESRYLDRVLTLKGSVTGLRALTKGGAYKFAVDNFEREIPIIGGRGGVKNSQSYYNKEAAMAEIIDTGITDNGIHPDLIPEKDFYRAEAERLSKLSRTTASGLTGPPTRKAPPATPPAKPKTAADYLKSKGL